MTNITAKQSKPLNLTDDQRKGCVVTYNINRFEVYSACGAFLTGADTKASLKEQLQTNGIKGAMFDGVAQRMYLRGDAA